ncbi:MULTISPECIES: carboxypeptidase regulatory-like domain-containing protein [Acidobacteriaceae]|uniref:carboxypeptidase regulatory-like domain-containing protein n=1 Tax=Acidobacteriaceae TaxID=204434 RepID=UPI00131C04EA|nr:MULTISPECIES: carboxypeptidase regulatory-like domain-containing protein [Acidobacteriaceae]MDW5267637.1 TonB-dependent receptor [Edaphobacter sp.]
MNARNPRFFLRFALIALALYLSVPAHAQFSASLSGTVQDSTGAIIPNAAVTLTDPATHQSQKATTSSSGVYHFSELPPAHYTLAVTATGFKASTFADVALAAETPRNLNVTLNTGDVSETVTVNANEVSALQNADASVGSTISSEAIQKLPIIGGNPYELLRTSPGITGDGARAGNGNAVFLPNGGGPGGSARGIFQTENQTQISANGQPVAANTYSVDGVTVDSLTHGGAAVVTPNQEAIGQITVLSTSYDAADGRNSGAQIKVVTKSGTNDLHGSLFFLYDEPGLNAFAKYGGPDEQLPLRVETKQRTYDASIGGPIIKDKLFGFASYSGFGYDGNTTVSQYVETPDYRALIPTVRPGGITTSILTSAGVTPRIINLLPIDCSDYANNQSLYAPVNGMTQTAAGGPYCNPIGGGVDIGSPTRGGASQLGVYTPSAATNPATYIGGGLDQKPDIDYAQLLVPNHSRGNQFNGRIDWYATQKDQFAGSFYITKLDNYGTSGAADSRPQSDVPFKPLNTAVTLIYIHTFSPSWLNELRGNSTRFAENALRDGAGTVNYGIPNINVQGMPFANTLNFGVTQSSSNPAIFAENTYEVRDQVTHTFGSHILRIGGEIRFEQDNDKLSGTTRPVYSMQGLWNFANDAPIYEGITASTLTGGAPNTQLYLRSKDIAGYVQHDWKVTPTFTLNTGFRYEIYTPISNKTGNVSKPVLGPPGSELSGMTLVPTHDLYNTDYGHYAPKIGFAWTPAIYNNNVVLRGGFAVAYNHLDAGLFNTQAIDNVPGAATFNVCCGQDTSPFAGGQIKYALGTSNAADSYPANPAFAGGVNANGFPANGAQIELYGVGGRIRNPVSYLYSLDTQTQLPSKIVLTVGYGGSLARHNPRLVNQNFLYNNTGAPTYAAYFAQTDSVQAYNSLNVRVARTLSHGFQIEGSYTFSKNMDQVSNGDGANSNANQTNPADNKSEYGPSDYDTRNRATISGLYTTPKVHSSNFLVKALADGWQVNGIASLHSGFPWTPVTYNLQSNLVPNAAVVSPTRPLAILYGSGPIGRSCSNNAYITGSNFPNRTLPGGTSGTAGGQNYFNTTPPTLPPGQNYVYKPGIGRNSFTGACYRDIDISLAKEVQFEGLGHTATLRFQANMFNAFNLLNLAPIQNGNSDPAANIQNADFGKATTADAGRQIEFLMRLNF